MKEPELTTRRLLRGLPQQPSSAETGKCQCSCCTSAFEGALMCERCGRIANKIQIKVEEDGVAHCWIPSLCVGEKK